MAWITKEGRTVEEAQDAAVAASGVPVEELEIEVVSEGAKGLFGLGGEPAVVRVRARDEATDFRHAFRDDITPDAAAAPAVPEAAVIAPEPSDASESFDQSDQEASEKLPLSAQQEQAAELGAEIVRGIIERMGLDGDVNTRVAGGTVYVEVFGEEMGLLIGRSGATLEALQELVRAGVQRRLKTRQALVVDVEAYWERRRTQRKRDGDDRRRSPRGERRGGGRRPSARDEDGNR